MLKLDNVTISYKNVPTVQNFNLDMKEGQIVSLVGESGSGKTTVIRAVLGLLAGGGKVTEGSITFEGEDLLSYTPEQWRKLRGSDISMIFQDALTALNPVMTIGKQMDEIYRCHEKISKKEAKMRSIKALKAVGIPDAELRYHAFPHELSGGMRQRVMIAMALCCNPGLLIADEPTTALDVTIQTQIVELLKDINKSEQNAMLFITHDLNLARRICHKVVVMKDGVVVEADETEKLSLIHI